MRLHANPKAMAVHTWWRWRVACACFEVVEASCSHTHHIRPLCRPARWAASSVLFFVQEQRRQQNTSPPRFPTEHRTDAAREGIHTTKAFACLALRPCQDGREEDRLLPLPLASRPIVQQQQRTEEGMMFRLRGKTERSLPRGPASSVDVSLASHSPHPPPLCLPIYTHRACTAGCLRTEATVIRQILGARPARGPNDDRVRRGK